MTTLKKLEDNQNGIRLDEEVMTLGKLSKDQLDLMALISQEPDPNHIKKNKFAGGSKYIPISQLEALLDSIFGPMNWKVSEPKYQILGGSTKKEGQAYMVCTLVLSVINTQFGSPVWVDRGGSSSGFIEHNTMTTVAPKMKAEAFKNAVKSLGKIFGRDLNRDHQEDITQDLSRIFHEGKAHAIKTMDELEQAFKSMNKSDQKKYAGIYKARKMALGSHQDI